MEEPEEQWPEGLFDIVWQQRDPEAWVAEIKDPRTDERCRVSSFEEMERFIRSRMELTSLESGRPL